MPHTKIGIVAKSLLPFWYVWNATVHQPLNVSEGSGGYDELWCWGEGKKTFPFSEFCHKIFSNLLALSITDLFIYYGIYDLSKRITMDYSVLQTRLTRVGTRFSEELEGNANIDTTNGTWKTKVTNYSTKKNGTISRATSIFAWKILRR